MNTGKLNSIGLNPALQKVHPGAVNVLHGPLFHCGAAARDPSEPDSLTKRQIAMRYTKSLFCELLLKEDLLRRINAVLAHDKTAFSSGVVLNKEVNSSSSRASEIRWIESPELKWLFDPIVADVSKANDWNFALSHSEHFQHARYGIGGKYDWHVDQHPHPHKLDGLIREVSFTLFLNDAYAGGELDLEIGSPRLENRCATFKNRKPGTMVFFLGDVWRRVRPVTSGVREALVGWYLGPPYV
jgi:PKHD-type hydroxylase